MDGSLLAATVQGGSAGSGLLERMTGCESLEQKSSGWTCLQFLNCSLQRSCLFPRLVGSHRQPTRARPDSSLEIRPPRLTVESGPEQKIYPSHGPHVSVGHEDCTGGATQTYTVSSGDSCFMVSAAFVSSPVFLYKSVVQCSK